MGTTAQLADRRGRGARGSVAVATVVLIVVVLAAAGAVFDGGRALAARRYAANVAEGAARAAVATAGPGGIDAEEAGGAARRHAAAAGVPMTDVTVRIEGGDVVVTVVARRDTVFLALGGMRTMTVSGQGRARLAFGA